LKSFDILEDIKEQIRFAQEDKKRLRIVTWLSVGVPDPSKEHNIAREKHEPTTGQWLINSEALQTWINAKNSLIWVNGGGT
jgi:hypothetical protein